MKKYARPLLALVMAVTFMVLYLTEFRHVIVYHEQHHLFVFTRDYLSNTIHEKGLMWTLLEFVVQFGYYPWLGAAVWTLLLVAVYGMTGVILRRLTGRRDVWGLSAILPAWMFYQTVNIDVKPDTAVTAFAVVLGVWILALIASCFYKPKARGTNGGKWWILIIGPAVFGASMAYFNRSLYEPRTLTLNNGVEKTFDREAVKAQRIVEARMVQADQAVRRGDWPEVQRLAEEVLADGQKNLLMTYFRSMALYHQGQLPQQILNMPQKLGSRSLYFQWKPDKNQAEYGGYVFEQLGALNTAIHWEFEALVGWGETSHHLINLSRYYIATGKPKQADKFLYPLKHTLFYRNTARELESCKATGKVPGLRDAFHGTKAPGERWDAVDNLNQDLVFLNSFDTDNDMAQQYLLVGLLLDNEVGAFYGNLRTLYPDGAKNLPELYQQALCLYRLSDNGPEKIAADGFEISPEVDKEFREYVATKQRADARQGFFSPRQKQSYWYYIHNISPAGKQVKI